MSRKMKIYAYIFVAFIINGFFISESAAYLIQSDTDVMGRHGGHEEITDWSIDALIYDVSLTDALRQFRDNISTGAREEDEAFFGLITMTHFYPKAAMRGQGKYDDAIKKYRDNQLGEAWETLGHALHLAQDMTAPSHANDAWHVWHYSHFMGYEWWVASNWNTKIVPVLEDFYASPENAQPGFGSAWSYIAYTGLMTRLSGYPFDEDGADYSTRKIVLPSVASEIAYRQVPMAIRASGGIFNMFWREVGSGGTVAPGTSYNPVSGNPDDNFDVSTRLIELEEMDPTKELWRDLYGRTGIKKNYLELYLGKKVTESYKKTAESTTEEEFNQNYEAFQAVLNTATTVAKHTFEEAYFNSPDVAVLSTGFVDNTAELLVKRLKEPIREVTDSFEPKIVGTQPVMVIPSAGLFGMENSSLPIPLMSPTCSRHVARLRKRVSAGSCNCTVSGRHPSSSFSFFA